MTSGCVRNVCVGSYEVKSTAFMDASTNLQVTEKIYDGAICDSILATRVNTIHFSCNPDIMKMPSTGWKRAFPSGPSITN